MSFEGIKFLQKISSAQEIIKQLPKKILFSHTPNCTDCLGQVYYFDATVWLFNHEQSPYPFHFYIIKSRKLTNALRVSCAYTEYVLRTFIIRCIHYECARQTFHALWYVCYK